MLFFLGIFCTVPYKSSFYSISLSFVNSKTYKNTHNKWLRKFECLEVFLTNVYILLFFYKNLYSIWSKKKWTKLFLQKKNCKGWICTPLINAAASKKTIFTSYDNDVQILTCVVIAKKEPFIFKIHIVD